VQRVACNNGPNCQNRKKQWQWEYYSIRGEFTRITHRKELEWWDTRIENSEVIPQAIWLTAKSLMRKDGSRSPTVIHDLLGVNHFPRYPELPQICSSLL
jgi:hypothetical protein